MNSAEFLDAVRAKHGFTSDYQVSKFLQLSSGRVSQFRTGVRQFDDATSIKIAAALGEAPLYVIATINVVRAKRTEVRDVWESCAKLGKSIKINGAEVLSVVSVGVLAGLADLGAGVVCILCKIRRLWAAFALCGAIAVTTGCAASPQEKVWQAMHLVDVAQTINGAARDDCFQEENPITRRLIGRKPSTDAVIVWGVAMAIAHYSLDRWLTRTGRADQPGWRALRYLAVAEKGFTVGRNHAEGTRVFGDNHCSWR